VYEAAAQTNFLKEVIQAATRPSWKGTAYLSGSGRLSIVNIWMNGILQAVIRNPG
jgi:hypothetical protein